MTKSEAKRYVCRIASIILINQIDSGAEWIEQDDEANEERVENAIRELAGELERRGSV